MKVAELRRGSAYAFSVCLASPQLAPAGGVVVDQVKRRIFLEAKAVKGRTVLIVRRANGRRHLLLAKLVEKIAPAIAAD